eukprot:2922424-Amphidinium_carterae.1
MGKPEEMSASQTQGAKMTATKSRVLSGRLQDVRVSSRTAQKMGKPRTPNINSTRFLFGMF